MIRQEAKAMHSAYDSMLKSIGSWGKASVLWTVVSLVSMNFSWAAVLVVVGLMSFYFYDVAAMFLVYAGVLLWAAAWNLLATGEPGWMLLAGFQILGAVLTYRDYLKYRNAKAGISGEHSPRRLSSATSTEPESRLAWLSLGLGMLSLVILCSLIPVGLALSSLEPGEEQLVYEVIAVIFELAVLGIPVGIAALFSGCRPKAPAIAGISLGAISVLLTIIGSLLPA
jgi:hypothetical protein